MKEKIYILAAVVTLSAISMAVLFRHTTEVLKLRSPFTRRFLVTAEQSIFLDLKSPGYYFAGIANGQIYLAGKDPLLIKSFSPLSLQEGNSRTIKLEKSPKILSSQILIDSLHTYVLDHQTNRIYSGEHDQPLKPVSKQTYLTIEMVPISRGSIIIRTLKETAREFTLAKLSGNPPLLERVPDILQNQIDGIFSTDGKLHYVPRLHRLLYIYLYRNEFILFDTTMQLAYRHHTLDTFAHSNLQVKANTVKNTIVLSQPPPMVNRKSYISGSTLLINSSVIGNKEDEEVFYTSSVIDVYDITTGQYRHSFYVPRFQGLTIKDIATYRGRIYVLYNRFLVSYLLPTK